MFSVLANSFSVSAGCCLFFSFCGPASSARSSEYALFHDAVCYDLLGPAGTAADFPAYRQWAFYAAEVTPEPTIAPLFSLWT
eukprot:1085753-Prorocentrum_minimum.AAC.1